MPKIVCEDCGEVLERDVELDDSSDGRSSRSDIDEIADSLTDEFEDKLEEIENSDEIEDAVDDVDDYLDGLEDSNDYDMDDIEVCVGKNFSVSNDGRMSEIENNAQRLSEVFRDRLRQKQRNKVHREQRTGRFDSNRMMQADRGSPRVFKREDEGRDLDYKSYFVLDRSTSMEGMDMESAENAVATLMHALELAEVDTELLELYCKKTRLMKTESQKLEDAEEAILRGRKAVKGTTPLGRTMKVLNSKIDKAEENTFVVIVTDGEPDNKDEYKEAIDDITVPVLGVELGSGKLSKSEKDKFFDFHAQCARHTELDQTLFELANNVML